MCVEGGDTRMTTRVEGLEFMALVTGETFVTVENYARVMTAVQVPAPYNTTLGRGRRYARLSVEWLCSTFLAQMLGDPKNAAERVPMCGDSHLYETRLIWRQTKVDGNLLDFTAPRTEISFEKAAPSTEAWLGGTVFKTLVKLVTSVAYDWNGPLHKDLHAGFKLTISTGKVFWAELELLHEKATDGGNWWISSRYAQERTPAEVAAVLSPSSITPIQRQAVIGVEHIQMLAALYAGTLKHESVLLPVTPFSLAPAPAGADAETKNAGSLPGEPAPSDCQSFAHATDDSSMHTQTNGVNNRGSNPGVCVSSSGKRVRAGSATNNRRRQHALAPYHHAPA